MHARGKAGDDGRVAHVLLLRHLAHAQVLAHQKFGQRRVIAAYAHLAAKAPHFARAQLAVIAPAPLGDVVKQRGHVKHPGPLPALRQLRAQGVFVREFGHEKAPHVAQHHERVLIDGVDVKQIVLHLPHDAAENPQIAPQHAGAVHQPQRVRLPRRGLEHAHEQGVIGGVGAKAPVHRRAGVVERAQRAGAKRLHLRAALVEPEGLQDGARVALVKIVAVDVQCAIGFGKPGVDAARRRRRLARGAQALGHDLKQDFAQLHHGLGAPVVAAHELLAGALGQAAPRVKAVFIAKSGGHGSLPLEHQPVFVPPGQQVQARANQPQQPLIARQLPRLARRGHAAGQIGPAAPETGRARHPADGVQIAQAAGRLLAIRLQRVGRVLLPGVALALLQLLGRQKSQRIQLRGKSGLKAGQQRRIARHPARFQPGRAGGDVLPRRLQTLRHGAHAVAHLQAHIPAGGHEGRYRSVQRS